MKPQRIILEVHGSRQLVQYEPSGERRVEDLDANTCGPWLHWSEADPIIGDPKRLDDCELDLTLYPPDPMCV